MQPTLPVRLSVPHNGDPDLPRRILESDWAAHVGEVYFAGNPLVLPSGRRPKIKHYIANPGPDPVFDSDAYDRDFRAAIRLFSARSIRSNLLLNTEIVLDDAQIRYVAGLIAEGVGAVTVGNVELLRQVHARWPRLAIQNSVYIKVESLDRLAELLRDGVSVFLIPPEWNHDLEQLRRARDVITAHGAEMKLMVNEGCIKYCPHRVDDLRDAQSYSVDAAMRDYIANPAEIRNPANACRGYLGRTGIAQTNYIHPADIARYAELDATLKIVGRSFPTDTILGACEAYVAGRHEGDLRLLVENFKHARLPVEHVPGGKAVFY